MSYLEKVRQASPLVFSIMNEVAANFTANGLIAIGASPSISNTPKEAEGLAQLAKAVILNLGTLSEDRAKAMMLAGKSANKKGVPVVLDPIAIGATAFRTGLIHDLLKDVQFSVICANAGEIAVLAGELDKTTSPDNALADNDPAIAEKVAQEYQTIVVSTGEVDVVTDGHRTALCRNGHAMLQNITASGCLLTAIIGAFISTTKKEIYEASIEAVTSYGLAAEIAMEKAEGPGSFIPAFLDQLHKLSAETLQAQQKVNHIGVRT